MKKSSRYLRGTFNTLAITLVAFIAANRIYTPDPRLAGPDRTPVTDLSTLQGFDSISAGGDFKLTVREQPTFSVSYSPLGDRHGEFHARVEGAKLILTGYGNRYQDSAAEVLVGLPRLQQLRGGDLTAVMLEGFTGHGTRVDIGDAREVRLSGNSADMSVTVRSVARVVMDDASAAAVELHVMGDTRIVRDH